jgi:hypothetical protein
MEEDLSYIKNNWEKVKEEIEKTASRVGRKKMRLKL